MNCKRLDSLLDTFALFILCFLFFLWNWFLYKSYFVGSMQLEVYYTVVVIWFFHHTWSSLLYLSGVIRNMAHKGIYPWIIYFRLGVGMCTCKLPMHTKNLCSLLQIYKAIGMVACGDSEFVDYSIPQTLHRWCCGCMVRPICSCSDLSISSTIF